MTALVIWCLGQAGVSFAQPSEAEVRAARDLFSNAVKEEDNNHWQAALTMFKQVSEVKLTAGVRYHLALCEEKLGDLAKALSLYTLAESQARQENARDVLRLVGKQVERLEPRVPRLKVHIVPNTSDALVTLDGAPLGREALDHPYPVDPGTHEIKAVSPGRIAAKGIIMMRESDMSELELKLEPNRDIGEMQRVGSIDPNAPRSSSTAAVSNASPPTLRDRTTAMLATTAAIALTAGGAAAFMMADRALDEGRTSCATVRSTSSDACDSQRFAVRAWDVTAAGVWTGAIVAGTLAVVLWTTSERQAPLNTRISLSVGPTSILAQGHF